MHETFNYLQRVSTLTQNMGKHWYSINYTTIPELYVVNTRATLWFDIVLDFLPSQHDGFRCHSFTIRDVLALKVFVRLNSIFLVFSPAFLTPGRLAISRRPSLPFRARKRLLSRLQFTYSYRISPYSLSYVLGGRMGGDRHNRYGCS